MPVEVGKKLAKLNRMQWATIWDEGRKELRKKERKRVQEWVSLRKREIDREWEREYGREVSNFLAISAAGRQARTHTQLWQRKRVARTQTHTHTCRHRTALREKGATFSFTVNIIFYCTINTKMARYFALAKNGFITWNCFSWWHKRHPTHTRTHTHTARSAHLHMTGHARVCVLGVKRDVVDVVVVVTF